MNIQKIISEIKRDPELKTGEKIIICLNKERKSMLEDAFLLSAAGNLQQIFWETGSNSEQADEAAIRISEDGDDLVVFHETRPNSKNRCPNGIRVHREELDFPCVVFFNSGTGGK